MFIQPDPFAPIDKIDNDATVATLKGDVVKAAIDGVTKTQFGSMTVTAAVTAETAVKWSKTPEAKGGAKQIIVSGATSTAAYVYCGVSKGPE